MKEISVVIPVYNERDNIKLLYSLLKKTLDSTKKTYEIIFVDDGSKDGTSSIIKQIKDKDMRLIEFQRNFGKSAAYTAAFKESQGEIIITMDGDLQDDPREIPNFLDAIEHYDLVVGWKFNRKDPIIRKIPSKIFNELNKLLMNIYLHDSDCGYRAMKRKVAEQLDLHGDLYRYIPAFVKQMGYKIGEIKVMHHKRKYGKSKFSGSKRLITGSLDLITVKVLTRYMKRPLHLFGSLGLLFFVIGFVINIYMLYLKYIENQLIGNRPLLLLGVLLVIVGIQFVFMGLLGELVIKKPRIEDYIIRK